MEARISLGYRNGIKPRNSSGAIWRSKKDFVKPNNHPGSSFMPNLGTVILRNYLSNCILYFANFSLQPKKFLLLIDIRIFWDYVVRCTISCASVSGKSFHVPNGS